MRYVSAVDDGVIIVTDSETGVSTAASGKGSKSVLGYIGGRYHVISKHLIQLLGYIDSIEFTHSYFDVKDGTVILVCPNNIRTIDNYNLVMIVNVGLCYDLMDLLMCASYSDYFMAHINSGVLYVGLGVNCVIKVAFCGNYKGYIAKLMLAHRGSWEKLCRMDENKLLKFDNCD